MPVPFFLGKNGVQTCDSRYTYRETTVALESVWPQEETLAISEGFVIALDAERSVRGVSVLGLLPGLLFFEGKRGRVDAEALAGGIGAIGKDMTKVRAAGGAGGLDAAHAIAGVFVQIDGIR